MVQGINISDAELEVMRILWREEEPVSFASIRAELSKSKGWEKSTIATLLRRLRDKGAVSSEEARLRFYSPIITSEEFRHNEEQSLIDRLYEGSAKNLVAALCNRGDLTESDIEELRAHFKMRGEGR